MKRRFVVVFGVFCAFALTSAALLVAPAAAATGPCEGHWVRILGGPRAVTRQPLGDLASLRRRLPQLEASINIVVTKDPSLGPVVAAALIEEIRSGSGIIERSMKRDEAILWMAYQPKPNRFDIIPPACLRLARSYPAFEITVAIPDPEPVAEPANCAVSATRSCTPERPTLNIDIRGTSPDARVTFAAGDQPAVEVGGTGASRVVADQEPYDLDAVVTVRAEGAPRPARTARVFRFLIPKICGNLAYLGEAASRTIAPEGEPLSCEKSVRVSRCEPVVAPIPPPVEEREPLPPVADRCLDCWVARGFLFASFPTGTEQRRDILLPDGPAWERFKLGNGFGLGGSLERRFGPVVGLEGALLFGRGKSDYRLKDLRLTRTDSPKATFSALTLGPNFHLLGTGGADLYVGPFLGFGGYTDLDYRVGDRRFRTQFDRRFLWGAQIGLDLLFSANGPWGFHGGLRYIDLSQDTDVGSIKIDPLLTEVGLFYRF